MLHFQEKIEKSSKIYKVPNLQMRVQKNLLRDHKRCF